MKVNRVRTPLIPTKSSWYLLHNVEFPQVRDAGAIGINRGKIVNIKITDAKCPQKANLRNLIMHMLISTRDKF